MYVIQTDYFQILDLLSDLGSQIGFWLGSSMISLVEFVLFLFQLVHSFMKKP